MDFATQNYMVKLFKMLSNSRRLEILDLLLKNNKPLCVSDIAERLEIEQSTLSSQLTRLRENKVIKAKQTGLHMYYSISDPNVEKLLRHITPMTITSPDLLATFKSKRFLGMDLGTKTIGLATSDPGGVIATPYKTIKRTKLAADLEELLKIIKEEEPSAVVLGLPINMDGTEGPRCQATRQFAHDLGKHTTLPIALWDERLSTSAVDRVMTHEADLSRQKRAQLVDKLAAAYILQGILDYVAKVR